MGLTHGPDSMGPMSSDGRRPRRRVWFGDVGAGVGAGVGVGVDVVTPGEAVEQIVDLARRAAELGPSVVVTPNVDHLVLVGKDSRFLATYQRAALVLADGMPLVMLSKLLRLPLRDKISGSDLIGPLMGAAAAADVGVFFLGATAEVTATASTELRKQHPALRIVGTSSPRYDASADLAGNAGVGEALAEIERAGARLVLVAFGSPKEGQLLDDFRDRLPPACYVACGASLDFAAGKVDRAPAWVSAISAEWLFRLAKEPGRLWKRYLVQDVAALPLFAKMIWRRLTRRPLVTSD